ncbi:MAG: sigma-70 family RNA polymerase sigma factor [Clostridia bacterium]|nr:sigma-70 family RNA polymerase sigma factor [Clostridia bacterium]
MDCAVVPGMNREERLNQWIETYSDAILRTCFLYLSDQAQAEDALQDTWIKAWKHMSEYENQGIQNEKAWLMRIAINTCKDYRRTAWFRHIDNRKALEELPDRLLRTEAEDRSLSLMIMDLPNRYKQVVLLYYFQGFTQAETAAVLGISPSSVLRRLRNAEALLKQSLTGGEEHER